MTTDRQHRRRRRTSRYFRSHAPRWRLVQSQALAGVTDLDSDALKIAHHGSRTSTSPAFLSRADPSIDVISVGASNSFGHPTTDVLDRLDDDLVLRTDLHGDITIETDGERIWIRTEHRIE